MLLIECVVAFRCISGLPRTLPIVPCRSTQSFTACPLIACESNCSGFLHSCLENEHDSIFEVQEGSKQSDLIVAINFSWEIESNYRIEFSDSTNSIREASWNIIAISLSHCKTRKIAFYPTAPERGPDGQN